MSKPSVNTICDRATAPDRPRAPPSAACQASSQVIHGSPQDRSRLRSPPFLRSGPPASSSRAYPTTARWRSARGPLSVAVGSARYSSRCVLIEPVEEPSETSVNRPATEGKMYHRPALVVGGRLPCPAHLRQSLWVVPLLDTVEMPAARQPRPAPRRAGCRSRQGGVLGVHRRASVLLGRGWRDVGPDRSGCDDRRAGRADSHFTLSPRFMRLWYHDRLQKFVLASFTATFAFSFSLLRPHRHPVQCPTSASRWPASRSRRPDPAASST